MSEDKKKIDKSFYMMVVILAMIIGIFIYWNPFKVIDPSNPRFNPDHFRFEDYPDSGGFPAVIKKLIPLGTSRVFVERVLVKAGKAKLEIFPLEFVNNGIKSEREIGHKKESQVPFPVEIYDYVRYGNLPLPDYSWGVQIQYGQDNKVVCVIVDGQVIEKL